MKKHQYVGIAAGVSMIAGILSIFLFSTIGYSLAELLNPEFYGRLFGSSLVPALVSMALMGVSFGSMLSGARVLGKLKAAGFTTMCALVVTLIGSVFFWNEISSYTTLAFGLFMGASIAGLLVSNARGSLFSIGFDYTKKAFIVLVIVAFIGSWLMVNGNSAYYKEQFTTSMTGLSVSSASEIDDAAIEQLIKEKSPAKMSWSEFLVEIEVDEYDSLTNAQQEVVLELYQNYTRDYDLALEAAVTEAKNNFEGSGAATELILESVGLFQDILENIALIYAISLVSLILLAQSLIVAPAAGLTSYAFQKPLPKEMQPKPEGELLNVAWSGE